MGSRRKKIKYSGLGFPVILIGFETEKILGEELPKLNHRKLEDLVFKLLVGSDFCFSGAHLAFVRKYMGMTQEQFAKELGMKNHSRISQWESKKQKTTEMSSVTEMAVRLLMIDYIGRIKPDPKKLREIMRGGLRATVDAIEVNAA